MDRDRLLEYVMGGLTPAEDREVAAHLREHPEDAAWVRDTFEALALLALAQEPAELPAGAEAALLARVRERPAASPATAPDSSPPEVVRLPRRRSWLAPLALAAALAVAAWVGWLSPQLERSRHLRALEAACAAPGATCETLSGAAGEPLGTLARSPENELLVLFEAGPPRGQVDQAWEIVGDSPRSLGTFSERLLVLGEGLEPGSAFGVTLEPPGGSPQPTSTPIVVVPMS